MQKIRILLLPFSWLYAIIIQIRNWLYDKGIFKENPIQQKSICIGNIAVGGTGKSPLTAYLAQILAQYNPVVLSRGYGRKTKGLLEANAFSTAHKIGDEPMMIWQQFYHKMPVIVSEKRQLGIDLIGKKYANSIILLDDAFQHRAVKAGLSLVLMTFNRPNFNDSVFPAGNLREPFSGVKRADAVVVTKCPLTLTDAQKEKFYKKIPFPKDKIFFSSINYGELKPLFGAHSNTISNVLVVTGIAQPAPLISYLKSKYTVEILSFPDHHDFTSSDITKIQQKIATFTSSTVAVVTTEKDAVRFAPFEKQILAMNVPFYVQQIAIDFDRKEEFNNLIQNYVTRTNERSS